MTLPETPVGKIEELGSKGLVVQEPEPYALQLGSLHTPTPDLLLAMAEQVATPLKEFIMKRGLTVNIQGNEYVKAEGWQTLATMVGLTPREKFVNTTTEPIPDNIDHPNHVIHQFEAYIEVVRNSDGLVIGGASAICRTDETTSKGWRWTGAPLNAPRSMAITRATSKALRVSLAWVMTMAGYKPTPAEEMDHVIEGQYKEAPKSKQQANDEFYNGGAHDEATPPSRKQLTGAQLLATFKKKKAQMIKDEQTSATERQRKAAAINLSKVIPDNDNRHSFSFIFCGTERIADYEGVYIRIIMDWLNPDPDNNWAVDPVAAKEAVTAIAYAHKKLEQ